MSERTVIRMPNLGAETSVARLVGWLRGPGDRVTAGEPLAELETDKATVSLDAPVTGVLVEIHGQPDTDVSVGMVLAVIEDE